MQKKATIVDIANALGISTATVHRALNGYPNVTAKTRDQVLETAKRMGYKPNRAARLLRSSRPLRISVNTLVGNTDFWNEVHAGIDAEKKSLSLENVELEYRSYPEVGAEELQQFEAALDADVDGIIAFPADPAGLEPLMRRAARENVPVVFVATDAPNTGRLAVVSIDTMASGSLAADIMAGALQPPTNVAVTVAAMNITEHAEKYRAFATTMATFYPEIRVLDAIEDHGSDGIAYEATRKLLGENPNLGGIYVTTENSVPVIRAARELDRLDDLTLVTTDLFPDLVPEIRSGAVKATIYQRPQTQGRLAFRLLYEFMDQGSCPTPHVTFAPHLVMRGNLEFFLQRGSLDVKNGEIRYAQVP